MTCRSVCTAGRPAGRPWTHVTLGCHALWMERNEVRPGVQTMGIDVSRDVESIYATPRIWGHRMGHPRTTFSSKRDRGVTLRDGGVTLSHASERAMPQGDPCFSMQHSNPRDSNPQHSNPVDDNASSGIQTHDRLRSRRASYQLISRFASYRLFCNLRLHSAPQASYL